MTVVILSILLFISLVSVAVLTYYVVSKKNCPVPPKLSKQISKLLARVNYMKDMNFDCFDCYIDVFTSDDMINLINKPSQQLQKNIMEALNACYENPKCSPIKDLVSFLQSKEGMICRNAFISSVMGNIPAIMSILQSSTSQDDAKAKIAGIILPLMQQAGCPLVGPPLPPK